MSTFDFLKPYEAIVATCDDAPAWQRITGLKGVNADRIPDMITRTAAGNPRKPEYPWRAHGFIDRFKVITRVEWAQDAAGTAEVFYADGSTEYIGRQDLLCVERPIGQHA